MSDPAAYRVPRCPSCSTPLPPRESEPLGDAFAGNTHLAPLLSAIWDLSREVLGAIEEPVPVLAFCDAVAGPLGASTATVRNVLDHARRQGLVRYDYRDTGKPLRRRAYVYPVPPVPPPASDPVRPADSQGSGRTGVARPVRQGVTR